MRQQPAIYRSAEGYAAVMADYDRLLKQWPCPVESLTVPTRYGSTHILASGHPDAPPLVLLHGIVVNAISWGYNAPAWSEHFRVYAVDLNGESGKSAPTRLPRDGVNDSAWLCDIFDALRIERAHVVGISLGGWLTLMFARHAPARVQRIVPMCPANLWRMDLGFITRGLLASLLPTEANARRAARYMTSPTHEPDEELVHFMHTIFKYLRLNKRVPATLNDDDLRAVQAPTLLLIGQDEVIYDVDKALQRARHLLPAVHTEVIPNAGHALNVEQADLINRLVLDFLCTADDL